MILLWWIERKFRSGHAVSNTLCACFSPTHGTNHPTFPFLHQHLPITVANACLHQTHPSYFLTKRKQGKISAIYCYEIKPCEFFLFLHLLNLPPQPLLFRIISPPIIQHIGLPPVYTIKPNLLPVPDVLGMQTCHRKTWVPRLKRKNQDFKK